MSYPPIPAPRIEYDRDGTRVYSIYSNALTELTPTQKGVLNDDNDSTELDIGLNGVHAFLFVFPELRDVTHSFLYSNGNTGTVKVEWSDDSTTGLDGTWTTSTANYPETTVPLKSREDILPLAGVLEAKMVKVTIDPASFFRFRALHLFGTVSTGQTVHRLRLWHPTLDEPLDAYPALLDWGNITQGTTDTKQFRIKNDSPTLDATGVTCFMQALTEATPTQVSQHTLSLDDATYVNSITPGLSVPDLVAQAISAPIFLKRTTGVGAQLGLWRQRLVAGAATWA